MQYKKENEDMLEEVNGKRLKLSDEKTMKKHRPSTFTFSTLKWSDNGLETIHQILELGDWINVQMSSERVVAVDIQSHQLLRLNEEDLSEMKQNEVLDLNDEGERWEGDILNNEPYGWGVLYDSDNRRVYEGFRVGNANVCYGRSYYPDIQKLEYEGEIVNGRRWGRGIQYDRSGFVMYDGEWMNDEHVEKRVEVRDENQLLHNYIEELTLLRGCEIYSNTLQFSLLPRLRVLQVSEMSIDSVDRIELIGMHALERAAFACKYPFHHEHGQSFQVKNCERLKELVVEGGAFRDFCECVIENVPSLEVLNIGVSDSDSEIGCFHESSLELRSDFNS